LVDGPDSEALASDDGGEYAREMAGVRVDVDSAIGGVEDRIAE